jgi:hypothetical protein
VVAQEVLDGCRTRLVGPDMQQTPHVMMIAQRADGSEGQTAPVVEQGRQG